MKSKLTYTVHRPKNMSPLRAIQVFGEQVMFGGHTADEWERRCAASLRASRRRRGLSPTGSAR